MRTWIKCLPFAGLFVFILIAAMIYLHCLRSDLRRQCWQSLQAEAQSVSGMLSKWRKERLADARVVAESPFLVDAAEQAIATGETGAIKKRLESLVRNYGYSDAFLASPDGKVVVSIAASHESMGTAALALAKEASNKPGTQVFMTGCHNDSDNTGPHVEFFAVMRRDESSPSIGYMAMVVDMRKVYAQILEDKRGRDMEYGMLCQREDSSYCCLYRLGAGMASPDIVSLDNVSLDNENELAALAKSGQPFITTTNATQGDRFLGASVLVPDSPWSIVCLQSERQALAPWKQNITVFLAIICGLLVSAALGFDWWRQKKELSHAALDRAILMSIGDSVLVTDMEGRVVDLNPAAEKLTGWSKEEAAGRKVEEVFRIINEKTRQAVEMPVTRVLREGIVVGLANHTLLIRRDGKELPIADCGAPIMDAEGRLHGAVLVFRDQTSEREAEHRLLSAIQRLETISVAAASFIANDEIMPTVNELCCKIAALIGCDIFFLFRYCEETGKLHLETQDGLHEEEAKHIQTLDADGTLCGQAIKKASALVLNRVQETQEPLAKIIKSWGTKAFCCQPLRLGNKAFGLSLIHI
mgnify:CR=1 FL=1